MKLLLRLSHTFSSIKNLAPLFSPISANYMEHLYSQWVQGQAPHISPSLQAFFKGLQSGLPDQRLWEDPKSSTISLKPSESTPNLLKVKLLIEAYRRYGHHLASLDPLKLEPSVQQHGRPVQIPDLNYSAFGLSEQDLVREYPVNLIGRGFPKSKMTLKDIISYLKSIYCDEVGFQFMHITDMEERNFLMDKVQYLDSWTPSKDYLMETLHSISRDYAFTSFLQEKFSSSKRFGIEGCESFISGLEKLVDTAAQQDVQHITVGMAHRGRLSTLFSTFQKPVQQIFEQFLDKTELHEEEFDQTGDVKYHLGYLTTREVNGKKISLELVPNPSHLEAVDPLVYGISRAKQDQLNPSDKASAKAIPIVVHGDAAISGQGIVYESLQLHDLHNYSVGGVIHIVINNQIGFTTPALQSRSTVYCTEIAKVVNAPVIHVNGDRPDLVAKCMQFAVEYRQRFHKDVFIDIIGFRKFGHNQQDQPAFTQPKMYELIQKKENVWKVMSKRMLAAKVITQEEVDKILDLYKGQLRTAYDQVIKNKQWNKPKQQPKFNVENTDSKWGTLTKTGVPRAELSTMLSKITSIPQKFEPHPTIKKILAERMAACQKDDLLDWPTMESLAFASLAEQGYDVRLSGQDVERGTFSHRHALLNHQTENKQKYMGLGQIKGGGRVTITNSLLSQFGVMGFEYGYSITNPKCLVCWEAQFGDFANTAQIMIDNFIASGEAKWHQQSGLTLLLPHGMDGQGPQHSSCRVQRYLQLCNDDPDDLYEHTYEEQLKRTNLHIVYCSQSSNYFHILRRQMRKSYRKPLIVLNSKRLLRFKKAGSKLSMVDQGTEFVPVIDSSTDPEHTTRIIFCTGQFSYDIQAFLAQSPTHAKSSAVVRIEQLCPFPYQGVQSILSKYKNAKTVVWCQEEHENQGCYIYMRQRMQWIMRKKGMKMRCGYLGRQACSASAGGSVKLHKEEQEEIKKKLLQ